MDKVFFAITPEAVRDAFRRMLEEDPLLPFKLGRAMNFEDVKKMFEEAQTNQRCKEIIDLVDEKFNNGTLDFHVDDWSRLTFIVGKKHAELTDR